MIHLSFKSINSEFARVIAAYPKNIDFLTQRSNINKGMLYSTRILKARYLGGLAVAETCKPIWSLGQFRPN